MVVSWYIEKNIKLCVAGATPQKQMLIQRQMKIWADSDRGKDVRVAKGY